MKTGKTVKVLLTAATAAGMLAGCGSKTDTDTFRFASELDIQGMDSTVVDDGMSFNAIHAITDGLTAVNEKGKTAPAIAKSWDVSDDGKTYTFHLRDAKWTNGDKVTANDFVYSWRKIIKDAGNYAYMLGSGGASVKNADALMELGANATDEQMATLGVTAKDDQTLVVELENKVPYFTDLMAFPCYFPQNEKFVEKCGKNYGTKPEYTLSNGAYKMTKWVKGNKATFTKNDKYYDAKTVATKNLEMYLVQDPKTAAQNFDNGKVDYATINSTLVDKYKGKDTFTTFNEGYLFYLQVNFKNNTVANKNVREALAYAINRKDLCENVLKDGSMAATGFVPSQLSKSPAGKDFRDDADKYVSYDQKKAQEYLDAAKKELGTDTITIDLLYGTDESPMDTMAEYLQGSFSKLKGLKVNMVATVKKDRIYNREANGNFQVVCTRWGPDYADPTTYLNLFLTGNQNNYGKYSNAKVDSLMKQVQAESDLNKRWDLMTQVEKTALDDLAYIPVFEKGAAALKAKNVKGLVHSAVGVPYTFKYVTIK
ncbi:aBC transporter substrate-binding protein family 5 [Catenibacterium sp. CAG:290]|uniref:peptide ABC transporter substrate-binding protein n=1 Tax=Catenibacterium sp. CAG:290 TaxID=1262767 RepID=UPI00033B9062|nr:peptide ABC transporter substrate-binding protein [Catenibacterium sp. CAG:290]CDE27819.1 aBC transporter substrate-binding protein family 5 [Catenibacterium sp. CAG:290]